MSSTKDAPNPLIVKLIEKGIKKFYIVWGRGNIATITTIWVTEKSYWKGPYLQNITWRNLERDGKTLGCDLIGAAGLAEDSPDEVFTNYWLAWSAWIRRGKK